MVTPGQLVKAMADALGISAATVTQYDRVLAENGLRSKGGRGLSAARVTTADAANLLIAIMGSPVSGAAIKDAARTCKVYGALPNYDTIVERQNLRLLGAKKYAARRRELRLLGAKKLAALPMNHSFCNGLIALIEEAMAGTMYPPKDDFSAAPSHTIVELKSPWPRANITVFFSDYPYSVDYENPRDDLHEKNVPAIRANLYQSRSIYFRTIGMLADTLGGNEYVQAWDRWI
jgi:hypothetical protein